MIEAFVTRDLEGGKTGMQQSRRERVTAEIKNHRICAIIRTNDHHVAGKAIQAAIDGGFMVFEITLTTPGALELINRFAGQNDLVIGAGTVLSPPQLREVVSAGARFFVAPVCDPEVLAEAAALDVASIPGCYTPTEMQTAYRHRADLIKVFPAPAGGVEFIKAVRRPLPHLPLFPTAGPTPDDFLEYLDAGCAGVGFGHPLFEPADLAKGAYDAIRTRAATITHRLAKWRETQ